MGGIVAAVTAVASVAKAAAPIISAVSGISGLLGGGKKASALPPPPAPPAPVEAPKVADPKSGVIDKPSTTISEQSAKIRTLKRRQAATRRGKLASREDSSSKLLGN